MRSESAARGIRLDVEDVGQGEQQVSPGMLVQRRVGQAALQGGEFGIGEPVPQERRQLGVGERGVRLQPDRLPEVELGFGHVPDDLMQGTDVALGDSRIWL